MPLVLGPITYAVSTRREILEYISGIGIFHQIIKNVIREVVKTVKDDHLLSVIFISCLI